ncbi:hypothetical protein [Stenotrophomonas indicatrix]|uniref:hypothetical protein n=1 Tax=Stenotrophomonas indicatrix TaxID=2045451 RepID=UPI002FDB925D
MPAKSRRYFSESGTAFSKDGYQFELKSERWRLNKDVSVSLELPSHVDHVARTGFRATLQRYAEEKSARHTENMCTRFKRFVRDTKTDMVTAESILNWRAILGRDAEWHLGGLKGFLIAWHDYGFDGVPDSVVVVLNRLRIKGNRKGQAVPFAQACLGKLVSNEREAIRGRDPRSRVPNGRLNAVGSCGSFGFCALGFSACYTCQHFQPWIDGPHAEVLEDLYREKERMRELNCSEVVFSSKDRLILAVEHCVALCEAAKNVPGEGFPEGGDGDHNSH